MLRCHTGEEIGYSLTPVSHYETSGVTGSPVHAFLGKAFGTGAECNHVRKSGRDKCEGAGGVMDWCMSE
jgi:hypothetical protein